MHTDAATDGRRWPTDGHGIMRPVVRGTNEEPRPPFVEPRGPLHWKPGSMNTDGAMCGATGVPFTGDPNKVVCAVCRGMMPTGGQ